MRISILTIGAVASIIAINSVFADTTVTSKQYVDTTRQATIPVTGTNANTPGSTVVTYTGTAGQIGERGIFNPETDIEISPLDGTPWPKVEHRNDLVTAGFIVPAMGDLYQQIEQATNNLPETTVTYKTCYQEVNGDCILWNLTDKDVYGNYCTQTTDCPQCGGTSRRLCDANKCSCIPGGMS